MKNTTNNEPKKSYIFIYEYEDEGVSTDRLRALTINYIAGVNNDN